jgi:hypothetical protein
MRIADVFRMIGRGSKKRERRRQRPMLELGRQSEDVVQTDSVSMLFETADAAASRVVDVPLRVLVGARVLGASLDNQLAAGRGPETSHLLAARAQLIVSRSRRRRLAENWLAILSETRDAPGRRAAGVPLVRDRILGARSQIHELVEALLAPLPTSRGVAMANSLLSDGTGPIYDRACPVDLGAVLSEVITRLNPMAV